MCAHFQIEMCDSEVKGAAWSMSEAGGSERRECERYQDQIVVEEASTHFPQSDDPEPPVAATTLFYTSLYQGVDDECSQLPSAVW